MNADNTNENKLVELNEKISKEKFYDIYTPRSLLVDIEGNILSLILINFDFWLRGINNIIN